MITCKTCKNKFMSFAESGICSECGEPWSQEQNEPLMAREPAGWKSSHRKTLPSSGEPKQTRKETDWLKVAVRTVLLLVALVIGLAKSARNFVRTQRNHGVNQPAENTTRRSTGVN